MRDIFSWVVAAVITAALLFIMNSSVRGEGIDDPIISCLVSEVERGGVVGIAALQGDPWTMSFEDGTDIPVPAEEVVINFGGDQGLFKYGLYGDPVTADNLYSLRHLWTNYGPPYYGVQRDDGSVIIITDPKSCSHWMVQRPTITPAGWEDHPLVDCLRGAYRATEAVEFGWRVSGGNTHVAFDDEVISLNGRVPLRAEGVVVIELFDGFVAIYQMDGNEACYTELLNR